MSADAEDLQDLEFPLGDYRVLQLLGRGGIGEVFVAQRRGSAEICALKRLRPDVQAMQAAKARIRREAHLATYLDHPNLCRVLDAGDEDGSFFLATEFVPGVDLERLIQALAAKRLALSVDMVVAVALGALAGLQHAHNARDPNGHPLGVVHRDLSPRNVMVTFDGEVKIIDFGIAHAKVDEYRTNPGVLLGTLKYLSPEQALGTSVDARSDLYTVGTLIYEMLTGHSVVSSGQTLVDALQQITSAHPPPIQTFNPRVPSSVTEVVDKALAKEPGDRFPSAEGLAEALRQAAGGPATPAALGRLVRQLFPEVEQRLRAVQVRARDNLTPPPREGSRVDPFSATSVAVAPNEMHTPTRIAQPDEPDDEWTRAEVRTALFQLGAHGPALMPTRLVEDTAWVAPALPTPSPPHGPRSSASSASSLRPTPRASTLRRLAVAAVAVAVLSVAVSISLLDSPSEPTPVALISPSVEPAQPGVEPRPEATALDPVPSRSDHSPDQPSRVAPARRPGKSRAPVPQTASPARDQLQDALTQMRRTVERGEPLDPAQLNTLIAGVEARARATDDPEAARLARRARDCLASCPTQEKILSRAAQALAAVRRAE